MRKTTRKIQRINFIPSQFTPSSYRKDIELLLEDPLEKESRESYFIQLSDLVAFIVYLYTTDLLNTGNFPNRLPHIINKKQIISWMDRLRPSLNTEASQHNNYGVVIYPR